MAMAVVRSILFRIIFCTKNYDRSQSFEFCLNRSKFSHQVICIVFGVQITQTVANHVQTMDSKMSPEKVVTT
jgi:hypothetical protein